MSAPLRRLLALLLVLAPLALLALWLSDALPGAGEAAVPKSAGSGGATAEGPSSALPVAGQDGPTALPAAAPGEVALARTEHDLRVVVRDTAGAPLAGATVTLASGEDWETLGTTGARGALSTRWPVAASGCELVARRDGYRAAAVALGPRRPEVVLELAPGAAIRGRVVRVDGGAPPAGVRVLASPTAFSVPPAERLRRAAPANPRLALALTDARGAFVLHGLDPEGTYVVRAGGAGWLARDVARDVRPEGDEVELVLRPLFGLRVAVTGPGGAPLRTAPGLVTRELALEIGDPDAQAADALAVSAALAGVDPLALARGARDERVFLFVAAEPRAEVAPLRARMEVPGYAALDEPLSAPRVGAGLAAATLELTPSAAGWGELRVRFVGAVAPPLPVPLDPAALDAPAPSSQETPPGLLRLVAEDGREHLLRVERFAGPEQVFALPFGRYTATFELTSLFGGPRHGMVPRELEVGAAPAALEYDFTGSAALTLRLFRRGGAEYTGRALVRVGELGTNAYKHALFHEAPYALAGVRPGSYAIAALTGEVPLPPGTEPFRGRVTLEEGDARELRLEEQR